MQHLEVHGVRVALCLKNYHRNYCKILKFMEKAQKYFHNSSLQSKKRVITAPQCSCPNKTEISVFNNSAEGRLRSTAVGNLSVIRRSMGQLRNNPVASPGGSPVCNRRKPLLCPSYVTMEPYQNRAGTYQSRGRQSQVTAESLGRACHSHTSLEILSKDKSSFSSNVNISPLFL